VGAVACMFNFWQQVIPLDLSMIDLLDPPEELPPTF